MPLLEKYTVYVYLETELLVANQTSAVIMMI